MKMEVHLLGSLAYVKDTPFRLEINKVREDHLAELHIS